MTIPLYPECYVSASSDDSVSFYSNTVLVKLETRIPHEAVLEMDVVNGVVVELGEKLKEIAGG